MQRLDKGAKGVTNNEDPNTGDDFDDAWLFVVA